MSAHYCIAVAANEVQAVPQRRHHGHSHGHGSKHSRQAKDEAAGAAGETASAASTATTTNGSGSGVPQSPARLIVTDMPAPAPKVPRTAHAALSPKELAAAVVHAHEEQATALERQRSLRSGSPSPMGRSRS